jgi:hypothetical protein
MKFGKRPARPRPKDLHLLDVTGPDGLTLAPIGFGHKASYPPDWGMLGNDEYGDCVWAGAAHETMLWNAINQRSVRFDDRAVLSDYAAVTGFDPATGAGDNGTDMHDAMNYRRSTGVRDTGGHRHKIGAFVSLEPGDWHQLLEALRAFDLVAIGFEVPASAMHQFEYGQPWRYVGDTNIEGGHYVPVVGRPHVATINVVTWGRTQEMTRAFYQHYNDEAYGIVSTEALSTAGKTAEGLDLDALNAALARL